MPNSKNDDYALVPKRKKSKRGFFEGRIPAITEVELELLRTAFLMGCDDDEACALARISTATLYNHQNANPLFLEWKNALKQQPFLKARQAIVNRLQYDAEFALKFMERKKKREFSPRAELVIDDPRANILDEEDREAIGKALREHLKRQSGSEWNKPQQPKTHSNT